MTMILLNVQFFHIYGVGGVKCKTEMKDLGKMWDSLEFSTIINSNSGSGQLGRTLLVLPICMGYKTYIGFTEVKNCNKRY